MSGLVGRWAAETWGNYGEVLFVGNDAKQARERGFAYMTQSIELNPNFNRKRRELPDAWHMLDAEATCLFTGTEVKAVANDYQGESGANPIMTIWTELWGFIHKDDIRFWGELSPSPTRSNSMRWIETYAGYEGESELLWGLYESSVLQGRQLTAGELGGEWSAFPEAPNSDSLVPCWVNEPAGIFAYWDSGEGARRMPWQQGDHGARYYASEATTQTPSQFERLHLNRWVSAESAFIPIEWWDACQNPLPLQGGDLTPLIVGLDAAVTGDSFGMVVVSRDPVNPENGIAVRLARKWDPPPGGAIDFRGPEDALRSLCAAFNVVEIAYDPYQLHDFATRLSRAGLGWFRSFSQGGDRLQADKTLYDLIVSRRIRHDGNAELRDHITNCNAKQSKDEDNRLRLVKKSDKRKIDLAVSLSMASAECLRLNL